MRYAYEEGLLAAERLVEQLSPGCARIKIAGSIRRQKSTVKDIEIVAIPRFTATRDLFGVEIARRSELDVVLAEHDLEPRYREDGALQGIGEKAKFYRESTMRIPLDLFVCNPDTWGVIFLLRTGSADFNKRLVMHMRAIGYAMKDGRIYDPKGQICATPEERDVFKLLKVKWREPEDRT